MKEIQFDIVDWIATSGLEPIERETLASLRILAGPDAIPVTEVEDTIAQTVRQHINVPAHSLARWLMVNWWRLRWEPARQEQTPDWITSHCIAAIGGDYAWPAIFLASDGEFIQLRLQSEVAPDFSAVRYLRTATLEIPATEFEAGVDEFLARVEARLGLRVPGEREFVELRNELSREREDAEQSALCRLQARAGIDPGVAPAEWIHSARALASVAGEGAGEEILSVTPSLPDGLQDAERVVEAMKHASAAVDLGWAELESIEPRGREVPGERGARLARRLRAKLGIAGPVTAQRWEQLLGVKLPLPRAAWSGSRALRGAFRNGRPSGRTGVLVTTPREDNQRFYLARLAGAALVAPKHEHVLPVSDAGTALQKFERSFAQEFLCPWDDLDAFTDDVGTNDEGIADAAAYFGVSELLVASTLVNKGKLARNRLPTR